MRMVLIAGLLALLAGCVETRFESPPGDRIEACDARWKGLWVDGGNRRGPADHDLAFRVDESCRFELLERPERNGPVKPVHIPVNFVHDRGRDYLVVADDQLAGLVDLPAPHGVSPKPAKSFFIARYRIRGDRLELFATDDRRIAGLVIDGSLDGTVDRSRNELHVYVRGDRARILDILRKHPVFTDRPGSVLERRKEGLEAWERARRRTP